MSTTYIQTRRKVFQYPDKSSAERALPRMRRADPTAAIVPPDKEFEVLRSTPSDSVVYPQPVKGRR